MDKETFVKDLIKKWENAYDRKHKGSIELNKDPRQIIPYWDDQFVKDLIKLANKLYLRSKDLEEKMNDLLKEVRNATKENIRLSDVASKASKVNLVDHNNSNKKETHQSQSPGNGTPPGEINFQRWGKDIYKRMSIPSQKPGEELHDTGGDKAPQREPGSQS